MQKVWHRAYDGWWYLTIRQNGKRIQKKLVRGPDDGATKQRAEAVMIDVLAAMKHAEDLPAALSWILVRQALHKYPAMGFQG